MTDTQFKRFLFSIKKGIDNVCKKQFNYTNEYWYNFKSYICGTELSFTICNECNNYKRFSNRHNNFVVNRSNTRLLCNCVNVNNQFDNDLVIFTEQEELFDRQFDDFDTVFVDIINDFNSYNSNVSNNNLHNTNMYGSVRIE